MATTVPEDTPISVGLVEKTTGSHLPENSPIPAELADAPTPEPTPPAAAEISKTDFGLLSAEGFNPKETKIKDRLGRQTQETLQGAFEKNLLILARQLDEYSKSSKDVVLTAEQEGFLLLWRQQGNKILDTADGWALTNLVIEQDLMLRMAALGKKLSLEQQKRATEPLGPKSHQEAEVAHERGLLESLKVALAGGVFGAYEVFRGIVKKDVTTLKLSDFNIDISQLPAAYRGYIEYLAPNINPKDSSEFIIKLGQARTGFYESLGVRPSELKAATPFSRVSREGINTEWVRIREQALERARQGRNLGDPATANEVFFEAQEATVRHFLDKFSQEIASQAVIETIAEASQMTAGAKTEAGQTIATLKARKEKLDDPKVQQELVAEKQKELDKLEKNKTTWEPEIETKQKTIDKYQEQLIAVGVVAERIQGKGQEQTHVQAVARLRGEETAQEQEIADTKTAFAPKIASAKAPKEKAQVRSELNAQIKPMQDHLENLRKDIARHDKILGKLREEIDEPHILQGKIDFLQAQIAALKQKIGSRANAGLRGKIAKLKTEINAGVDPLVETQRNLIDVSINALVGYDRVVADVINQKTAETKMVTGQELASSTPKNEYGNDYEEGYLRILDHIFQYTHAPDRRMVFEAAKFLLSPDELAKILNQSLNLGLAGINAASLPTVSNALRNNISAGYISQHEMGPVFLAILNHVEEKSKYLGESS